VDLDQRILDLSKAVERKAEDTRESSRAAESGQGGQLTPARVYRSPGADEQKTYNEIIDLIRNKKDFDTAISRLYEFIDEYPEGDLTVNAYYWLGEVYLAEPRLEQAKQAFTIVATRFSDHRKAPDSVYKLGVTLDRMGEKDEAKRRMQSVVDNYPNTGAADLARKYLEKA
jgi:tol-pal system protein YbgF